MRQQPEKKKNSCRVIRSIKTENVTLVDIDDICTNGIIENEAFAPAVVVSFAKKM